MFLPIYYQEAALILTQADQLGYEPLFFGCDGMDGILTMEGFDSSWLRRNAADPVQRSTQPMTRRFLVKKYKEQSARPRTSSQPTLTTVFTLTSRHSRMQAQRRICPLRTCATR